MSNRVNIRLTRADSDGVGVKLEEDMVGVSRGASDPVAVGAANGKHHVTI